VCTALTLAGVGFEVEDEGWVVAQAGFCSVDGLDRLQHGSAATSCLWVADARAGSKRAEVRLVVFEPALVLL
jgi:hypothetical protein